MQSNQIVNMIFMAHNHAKTICMKYLFPERHKVKYTLFAMVFF